MFLRFAPNDKPETGALSAAYPTQAQRQGLPPISCHAVLERSAYAPFIKEKVHGVYQRHKPPQENRGTWGTHGSLPAQETACSFSVKNHPGMNRIF
jgi:hypothetical protein